MPGLFITGTDTGVGKTLVATALLSAYASQGLVTAAMKPVASGCEHTSAGLRNDDALRLQGQATLDIDYSTLNPYAFAPAIAPHIAARQAGISIDLPRLVETYASLAARADVVVVEGAGGWYVPLDAQHSMADLARDLALPVILVVGMRLGCINHALLTAAAIRTEGLPLTGWVANTIDPDMPCLVENLHTLQQTIHAPCLGVIPHRPCDDADTVASHLSVPVL
jgi:dethiobiotin synthetase